jgi:hypothetical protein
MIGLSFLSVGQDTLLNSFKKGKISGYWRNYFMATDNSTVGQDWYALATGGLLKYQTADYEHFSIGLGVYHSSNLISNVNVKDSITNKVSRYEAGLFDVADLTNKEITFFGEAYLQYKNKNHLFKLGRFKIKSPFLNPEDGRMIPTLEQGIYYQYKPSINFKFTTLFITHIAPRSTSKFYSIDKSIGLYPSGKNADGTNSQYKGNIKSKGLWVTSLSYKKNNLGVNVWDYYVDNIFNTFFIEPSIGFNTNKIKHIFYVQYINQFKINNGGNKIDNQTYFHNKISNVLGLKYQIKLLKKWVFSANFNHITNDGQFLFPREWGREFLFVFQKRERLEGVANTNAWMFDVKKTIQLKKRGLLSIKLGYGQYYRPDAKDFLHNKYAMPANDQLNLDFFYFLNKNKQGLGIEYLIAYKGALGNTYNNQNFILNKVNMFSHNLVVHYRF